MSYGVGARFVFLSRDATRNTNRKDTHLEKPVATLFGPEHSCHVPPVPGPSSLRHMQGSARCAARRMSWTYCVEGIWLVGKPCTDLACIFCHRKGHTTALSEPMLDCYQRLTGMYGVRFGQANGVSPKTATLNMEESQKVASVLLGCGPRKGLIVLHPPGCFVSVHGFATLGPKKASFFASPIRSSYPVYLSICLSIYRSIYLFIYVMIQF